MSFRNLRRTKPLESEIQAGVLELLSMDPHVAWSHKQFVGEGVLVRPLNGGSVRKQLQPAINLGIIKASQMAYIKGAPEGVLDIGLQLAEIPAHCELEVKVPGQMPTRAQWERVALIRANGGLADWVEDIDQVQGIIARWRRGG